MSNPTMAGYFAEQMAKAETPEQRTEALFQQARFRVEHIDRLEPYMGTILDTDWTEGDEHLEWVINAPVDEIVAWAEEIEENIRLASHGDEEAIARIEHRREA